jgi:hypothetical protein
MDRGINRCFDRRRRRLENFNFFLSLGGGGWKNSIFFWFSAAAAEIFLQNYMRKENVSMIFTFLDISSS